SRRPSPEAARQDLPRGRLPEAAPRWAPRPLIRTGRRFQMPGQTVSDTPVERFELAPGYTISRLIKGGWHLAGGHGRVDRDQAIADMARFVEAGVTTFDCADHYTGVEALIGDFFAAHP